MTASTSRRTLPPWAMTIYGVVTAVTFSACTSAPTPLYHFYQQDFGLSPLVVTIIFASYAFSLLAALLTAGGLSDYVGRRPVTLAAIIINAIAMVLFIVAHSAAILIAARVVQGFAIGIATTTLSAAILDTDKARGPLLNSVTAFLGLAIGSLGAGFLITFAPYPAELVYVVLLIITAIAGLFLIAMPETTPGHSGAWASLRPHVAIPPQARAAFARITPVNIAAWALGGFYLSLMPSLVRTATGLTSPLVGASVVSTLMFTAVATVVVLCDLKEADSLMAGTSALALGVLVTLAGVWLHFVSLMFVGTFVAGIGFGAAFSGVLRTILPLAKADERAGLLSTFYVESYLAFSLPAIAAGIAARAFGLPATIYIYGMVVVVLAVISLVATRSSRA
jgi:hypothetical protein